MFELQHNSSQSLPGYWGQRTSSINWCEPDYIHSYYIAEMYNTMSNLFYIFFGLFSIHQLNRFYAVFPKLQPLRKIYACCTALVILGLGSFLFHMCLTSATQAMDEIAMNVGILSLIYSLLTLDDYAHRLKEQKTNSSNNLLKMMRDKLGFCNWRSFLSFVFMACTLVLLLTVYDIDNPTLFQSLFAASFLFLILLSIYRIYIYPKQFYKKNTMKNIQLIEEHTRVKKRLFYYMLFVSSLGYALWVVDHLTCPKLEVLKLHSIWHLMTSFSCYLNGLFIIYSYYVDMQDFYNHYYINNSSSGSSSGEKNNNSSGEKNNSSGGSSSEKNNGSSSSSGGSSEKNNSDSGEKNSSGGGGGDYLNYSISIEYYCMYLFPIFTTN